MQVSACWPSYFLLLRQKESSQRKGEPVAFYVFGLQRAFLLDTGLAPAAGLTFLCFAKEK
jgi:hypothetical protein